MGNSGSVATKLVVGLVALGCIGLTVVAFRYSRGRGRESDAEREANQVLVALAKGMAKCALNTMPAAGTAVPMHLVDVSEKSFASRPDDWKSSAFGCTKFTFDEPQVLQYRWERESETRGRVVAIGDLNADKIPDKWFEIVVECQRRDICTAPNYVTEVLEDGVREPPAILRWVGRAHRALGEPPSLAPDAPIVPASASASVTPAAVTVPAFPPPGSAAPLDQIYLEGERLANRKTMGVQLVSFEAKGLRARKVEPEPSTTVVVMYGQPNAKGIVAKGEPVVSVTFGAAGLTEEIVKAPRELHRLMISECTPEQAFDALHGSPTLSLIWDAKRERSLWQGTVDKFKTLRLSTQTCAIVK
jgi:hypothetical protein